MNGMASHISSYKVLRVLFSNQVARRHENQSTQLSRRSFPKRCKKSGSMKYRSRDIKNCSHIKYK